jgi:hypothetical protein
MDQKLMMEIPFVPEDRLTLNPKELTSYLRDRLPQIASVAEKLIDSGSLVKLTAGGLAFQPSSLLAESSDDPEQIQKYLETLDIDEQVREIPSRSFVELESAETKLTDRVEYDELDSNLRNLEIRICSCCQEDNEEKMTQLEQQYGRRHLLVPNEYERGILHGKLEAIRWAMGHEWEDPEERVAEAKFEKLLEDAQDFELVAQINDRMLDEDDDPEISCDDAEEE